MVFYNEKSKELPKEIVDTNNKIQDKQDKINKLKEQVMDLDLMLNYLVYKAGNDELQKKN
tara:strand:- start:277 stop:456 length:180 start_codon:yes stop_codon:yes gene_type:complete